MFLLNYFRDMDAMRLPKFRRVKLSASEETEFLQEADCYVKRRSEAMSDQAEFSREDET